MIKKEDFTKLLINKPLILDGATGSNLQKVGMPRGCCTEAWILDHPDTLVTLQRQYVASGSQVIYAPTFQAQPIALQKVGLENKTEKINEQLVQLSRSVSDSVLVAGNLTTLAAFTDSFDEACFDLLVENYRRQIKGLLAGGADLLAAETLMYPTEAEAILTAAELEGPKSCFTPLRCSRTAACFQAEMLHLSCRSWSKPVLWPLALTVWQRMICFPAWSAVYGGM